MCARAGNRLLELDKFQSSVTLGVNGEGQTSVPSRAGALLTIVLYILLAAYGAYKIMRVIQKENYNLMQSTDYGAIKRDEWFTADDGFKIAFYVKSENGISVRVPPKVGSVSVYVWEWGM